MSDGPHRSLPMRPGWKRVAERGANIAFPLDEVRTAIASALERDCRYEMTTEFLEAVRAFCRHQEGSLFKDAVGSEIEALRSVAGFGMGRTFLDNVAPLSAQGIAGLDALVQALTYRLADRTARNARQIEEHYCRNATQPKLQTVRSRVEQAIGGAPFEAIARRVLDLNTGRPVHSEIKQRGLDDGVRLL